MLIYFGLPNRSDLVFCAFLFSLIPSKIFIFFAKLLLIEQVYLFQDYTRYLVIHNYIYQHLK